MFLLSKARSFLPDYISSETQFSIRAASGALSAAAFSLNPLAGVLAIAGHATWEYFTLFVSPSDNQIMSQLETYQEAFEVLELEARRQGHTCTPQEISNVKQIFFVHNLIEEVGYKAFYEIVQRLGITEDRITEEQSETIIAYVKKQAHVELRKPGGYTHSGRDMITAEQFSKVIASLSTIIHDRDERLTHARYLSLADLVTAFDDHNSYIKQLLFRSWFKCENFNAKEHLDMIKNRVNFNRQMSWQLETDFRYTLEKRKNFYDINFPGLRTVEDRETYQLSAKKFVNISNVRSELQYRWNEILRMSPDLKMGNVLAKLGYDSSRIDKLTEERKVKCKALANKEITQDKLIDRDMTLAEFIAEYVPERASTSENEVQKALSSVFK